MANKLSEEQKVLRSIYKIVDEYVEDSINDANDYDYKVSFHQKLDGDKIYYKMFSSENLKDTYQSPGYTKINKNEFLAGVKKFFYANENVFINLNNPDNSYLSESDILLNIYDLPLNKLSETSFYSLYEHFLTEFELSENLDTLYYKDQHQYLLKILNSPHRLFSYDKKLLPKEINSIFNSIIGLISYDDNNVIDKNHLQKTIYNILEELTTAQPPLLEKKYFNSEVWDLLSSIFENLDHLKTFTKFFSFIIPKTNEPINNTEFTQSPNVIKKVTVNVDKILAKCHSIFTQEEAVQMIKFVVEQLAEQALDNIEQIKMHTTKKKNKDIITLLIETNVEQDFDILPFYTLLGNGIKQYNHLLEINDNENLSSTVYWKKYLNAVSLAEKISNTANNKDQLSKVARKKI